MPFRWQEHGRFYDAFVVYRPTREVRAQLFRNARLLAAAGGWFSFIRRAPSPAPEGDG